MMFQCFNMFQKQCNMKKSIIYQSKKRSCPKFQIKKMLHVKHGQIIASISQVSMFHMFLYIIDLSLKHSQELLEPIDRARAFQLVGRQNYTSRAALIPAACSYGASGFCLGSSGLQPWRQCHEQSCFCRGLGPRTKSYSSQDFQKNKNRNKKRL